MEDLVSGEMCVMVAWPCLCRHLLNSCYTQTFGSLSKFPTYRGILMNITFSMRFGQKETDFYVVKTRTFRKTPFQDSRKLRFTVRVYTGKQGLGL